MHTSAVLRAWGSILAGRTPALSIEITRECPLRCPGCYAYGPDHLGGGETLRDLNDYRGQALIDGVLEIVDRARPLHISLVGGDPLVRYRELEVLVPQLLARGVHVQIVTSAFRRLPDSWIGARGLTVAVSIDGLAPEHDARRKPATYDRILKNIAGHRITVHCTITAQMLSRESYLDEFLEFWSAREEAARVWFSLFTPQRGEELPECLSPQQRRSVVEQFSLLRLKYPKLTMGKSVIREFLNPPSSPSDCIFSQTTETISADLETRITPCQFGGNPDCAQCGCYASMALASIGAHRLGGVVPVGAIFRASIAVGRRVSRLRDRRTAPPNRVPELIVLQPGVSSTWNASAQPSSAASPAHRES
jgi:MoaA/NifB/PqqE/SkfB family radical SAM enzyme